MAPLLLVAVAVITVTLGSLTVVQRPRDKAAWAFALTMLAVAVWSVGIAAFLSIHELPITELIARVYYIAAAVIPLTLLYMSLAMIDREQELVRSWTSYLLLAIPTIVISLLFALSPGLFFDEVLVMPDSNTITLNPSGYAVFMAYFILYYSAALISLILGMAQSRGLTRARLRYLAYGYTIGGLIGMAFNLILPILGNYQWIWAGPLGLFVFVPIIYVTITRFGLFDIRQAAARTTAYVSTLAVIGLVYAAIGIFISGAIFNSGVTQLGLLLVAALSFHPLKLFFDRLTDRVFYRNEYHLGEFYADLTQTLSSTVDLQSLLKTAARTIQRAIKSDQVFFWVYDETNHDQVRIIGTTGHSRLSKGDIEELVKKQSEGTLFADWLANGDPARRLMVSHRIAVVQFLMSGDELLGGLCLGEQQTRGYVQRDLEIVQTISNELTIAIQNARSVQALKELNENLQQRIDNATSELRHSNAQLQRLDEAKDEFISMASHQLRTPLTSIKGYISMMVEGDVGKITDQQKKLLNEAFNSSERMVRLINDFLNVSRLQTGKFTLDRRPIDLVKVVKEEIHALTPSAESRGLGFTLSLVKKVPILEIDEGKIRQVIMNFADNAVYYSKENSKIKISLKLVGNSVEFTVKDAGIGVPEDEKNKLFQKFFRAANARRQRPDGTGIGLFLAKKVIDAHHGQIVFESIEKKGSTFGFRLPIK